MAIEIVTTQVQDQLKKLLFKNMEKEVRDIVKQVLREARNNLSKNGAKEATGADPRKAYKAINYTVYKQILGGNINIAPPRRGKVQLREYNKPRKTRSQIVDKNGQHRGGNCIQPSERTKKLDSYYGYSRGFILRFLNAGTSSRTSRYGNRGSIAARNWFPGASQKEMEQAAQNLAVYIDKLIQDKIDNS